MDLGRALHVQGFVRTFVIEDFDEVIEALTVLRLRAVIIIFQIHFRIPRYSSYFYDLTHEKQVRE
jgi:hypothetical protein